MKLDNPIIATPTVPGGVILDRSAGTYLQYDSYGDGNVTNAGGGLYGSAAFASVSQGMTLTTTTSQGGAIYWNCTDFDFASDFRMSCQVYASPVGTIGDGMVMGIGGSTYIDSPTSPAANGALKARYYTYTGNSIGAGFTILNGSTTIGRSIGTQNWNSFWIDFSLEARTNGLTGRRVASLRAFQGDNGNGAPTQAGADITSWTPGGTYFYLEAATGAAAQATYVRNIILEYI